mmetsp:Transcript_32450/g.85184  ORF Transcript_32450/g.85184 Transcript_32450/m.85184 type:complete len:248 (-) Transcript_32450:882-1625(-)
MCLRVVFCKFEESIGLDGVHVHEGQTHDRVLAPQSEVAVRDYAIDVHGGTSAHQLDVLCDKPTADKGQTIEWQVFVDLVHARLQIESDVAKVARLAEGSVQIPDALQVSLANLQRRIGTQAGGHALKELAVAELAGIVLRIVEEIRQPLAMLAIKAACIHEGSQLVHQILVCRLPRVEHGEDGAEHREHIGPSHASGKDHGRQNDVFGKILRRNRRHATEHRHHCDIDGDCIKPVHCIALHVIGGDP